MLLNLDDFCLKIGFNTVILRKGIELVEKIIFALIYQ